MNPFFEILQIYFLGTDLLQEINIPDSKKTWIAVVKYTVRIIPLVCFSILQYFLSAITIPIIAFPAILNALNTFILPSFLYIRYFSSNNIPFHKKFTHYFSIILNSLIVLLIFLSLFSF
jgi:hypothetical protein